MAGANGLPCWPTPGDVRLPFRQVSGPWAGQRYREMTGFHLKAEDRRFDPDPDHSLCVHLRLL